MAMPSKQDEDTQIGFRPARETDLEFLYQLHVLTMKEYVDQTWGWDEPFQQSVFRKNFNPAELQVVTFNNSDIGMIAVEYQDEVTFLRVIEIHPHYQRQELGTHILRSLLDKAAHSRKPVVLRVLKVNPAQRLYQRLGFKVVEETATHYIMRTAKG